MKSKKITRLGIISSGFSLLLVLVFLCVSLVAFSGMNNSSAWFVRNEEVSAEDLSVILLDDQVHATLSSYAVSDISENLYSLAEATSYRLPTHDEEGISYSEYKKALAVVIEIYAHKDMTVTISLDTLNEEIICEEDNFISNAVRVTKTTYDPSARTATLLAGAENEKSFITMDGNTATKDTSLDLDSIDLVRDEVVAVCYILEYNEAFFDYARTQNPLIDEMTLKTDIDFIVHSPN